MAKQRLIVVSNRLPVSVSRKDGELVFTPSAGGLATAMASLDVPEGSDRLWIGWPGIPTEDLKRGEKLKVTLELRKLGYVPVFLTRQQVALFYEGYANDTIWPLFHYFQSYAQYDKRYWEAYQEVNELFMKASVRHATTTSSFWIHDYHLMLLPRLLRQALPNASIGFFLHIPFPSYEIFRLLPNRKEILQGLLGANLVGFHIYDYARHFQSSVLRILGIESKHGVFHIGKRIVTADAFPIGIDYDKFVAALSDKNVIAQRKTIVKHHPGQKLLLSVDRLDYSKGIMKRLEAFEEFIKHHPEQQKKYQLIVIAVPSRIEVETYKRLRDDIEKYISRINGTYGTVDWVPISYQFKNLPFHELVALYAESDIALVTPLRDGMNLVAKEYLACKQDGRGVLILSEMAGAIDELPEALRINPNNIDSIVQAVEEALAMPKKQQALALESMQSRLSHYTVQRWAEDFMTELALSTDQQERRSEKLLTPKNEARLVRLYRKAQRRLVILDYDGTIKNFVKSPLPEDAAPDQSLLQLVSKLAAQPRTTVAIVSGRSRTALDAWFGDLPVSLAAEHGAWMKYHGQWSHQQHSLGEYKKKLIHIMHQYADRTPGAIVETKDFALVWHYRMVPTELAHARNASLRHDLNQVLAGTDIEIHNGSKIIEVKPRGIHKGAVAEDLAAVHKADFILCMGDDYTDEDMFKVLPEDAFTIKVSVSDTNARYQLQSVEDALALLEKLSQNQTTAIKETVKKQTATVRKRSIAITTKRVRTPRRKVS